MDDIVHETNDFEAVWRTRRDHLLRIAWLICGDADLADATPSLRHGTRLAELDVRVARQLHRSTQRRHLLVGAAAATTVAAGGGLTWALTRSDDRSRGPQRVTAADPTTTTITASSAADWQKIPPAPLSERTNPVVVWAGDRLIVWGGDVYPAGDAEQHPPDGAAWVPGSDTWTPIAPARAGLLSGGFSVWDGTEVIVGPTEADSEAPWNADASEEDAQYGIAAYDPAADRWRNVAPIPVRAGAPLDSGRQAVVVGDQVVNAVRAVLPLGAVHQEDVMILDVRTGERRFLEPGPFAASPYDDASGTVALTAVGDVIVATPNWDRRPWVLDLPGGDWRRAIPPPGSGSSSPFSPAISAGTPEAGTYAILFERDRSLPPLAYDPAYDVFRDPWQVLAANPFPPARWDYDPVWTDEELVVPGAAYHRAANRWRKVPPPPRGPGRQRTLRSSWTGDSLLLFGGEEFTCPDNATCDRNPGPDTLDGWLLPSP